MTGDGLEGSIGTVLFAGRSLFATRTACPGGVSGTISSSLSVISMTSAGAVVMACLLILLSFQSSPVRSMRAVPNVVKRLGGRCGVFLVRSMRGTPDAVNRLRGDGFSSVGGHD